MKKLLTVFVILVLGFAAIIFILKQKEEQSLSASADNYSTASIEAEKTNDTNQESIHVEDNGSILESSIAETYVKQELTPEIEAKLKTIIPDMGGLEKIVLIPPMIDAVENNKEIPDLVVKIFDEKNVDLGDVEGDTYKEKLNFYVETYREEILQWLKSQ